MNNHLPIALHILGSLASRDGEALTSEEMSRTYGTSPVVLRRVLAQLQRANLVETRRGTGGGSVLARDPRKITIRQAYEAVAGDPVVLTRHPDCEGRVERALASFMNDLMGEAEAALLATLETVSVAEMDIHVRTALGHTVRPLSP